MVQVTVVQLLQIQVPQDIEAVAAVAAQLQVTIVQHTAQAVAAAPDHAACAAI